MFAYAHVHELDVLPAILVQDGCKTSAKRGRKGGMVETFFGGANPSVVKFQLH